MHWQITFFRKCIIQNCKYTFLYFFNLLFSYLFFFQSVYALDPFNRLKYKQQHFIASFNNVISPALHNIYPDLDSTIYLSSNTMVRIDNNIPNIKTGILFNGTLGSFSFFIEPILVNKVYGLTDLGTEYSRNNISGRFENAFIRYNNNNLTIRLGRSSILWGQSISRSIIQSGLYPSYDHLLLRYGINNFHYELLSGQLGSRKTEAGNRIKRNIGGHRLAWKINDKMLISIGEQIIYTGLNRNIELTYLNPFVPYFFTGLEIDSTLTEYADIKTIYPGDIVIFNKKNHPNDGIKAKIKKVTKGIQGLEAKKKGIDDKNLPKYYNLKFLHPPTINLKRVKHLKDVEEKYLKKLFVKKTYKCIPSYYNEQKFKDELERFAKLHFTKKTPFIPQQIIARLKVLLIQSKRMLGDLTFISGTQKVGYFCWASGSF